MQEITLRVKVHNHIWLLHGVLSHMVRASKDVERPYLVLYADRGVQQAPLRRLDAWNLLWGSQYPGFRVTAFTASGARIEIEESILLW